MLFFFSHASCQSHQEMTLFFKRTFSHLRIRKTLYLRMLRKKHYLYHLLQQVKATASTVLSSAADGTGCCKREENGLHGCCCDLAWHFLCSSLWSAVAMFLLATASSQRSQKSFQVLKNPCEFSLSVFHSTYLKPV